MKETAIRPILSLLLFLTLATPALAGDGVLEINQTCAVGTGCFLGDTPGFPVTIFSNGRFRLTSNLEVPNPNTDAIVVGTDDVGIDLNNFLIFGGTKCSGVPLVCSGLGTGSGVKVVEPTLKGLSVKNGSITGMGSYGVQLRDQAQVSDLHVRWNGGSGIRVGFGSSVSTINAYQNGVAGISMSLAATVLGSAAYGDTASGISADTGSTVSGNSATNNRGSGISALGSVTVSGNTK